MRFKTIQIPAYGPFTGLEVELPSEGTDFHLFHGPNEAGKSSLLRSLRALLFGIHPQTPDNFLHGYNQMRIAAELESRDGTTQLFQRRKGNKNTLLDGNNQPLHEEELRNFLGGVDEGYFDSMFGLGSAELRAGADALLRGEGRLGEALFSASLGGTPVDKVLKSLEAEASALFKGRAGSRIRIAHKEFAACMDLAKTSIVKADEWSEVEKAIQRNTGTRDLLLTERQEQLNRKAWLERRRDALPVVGQYRDCLRQLEAIADIPDLSGGFGEEIREARRIWLSARNQIETLEIQLNSLHAQVLGCDPAPEVLAGESEVDRLHTGIGAYRDQKRNLGRKQVEAERAKLLIEARCQELEIDTTPEKMESGRISQIRFLEAEQVAGAVGTAGQAMASADEKSRDLLKEIGKLGNECGSVHAGDTAALEAVVDKTKHLGETAAGLPARLSAAADLKCKWERLHTDLPGSPAEPGKVSVLEVPSKSTIEQARENFDELSRRARDLENRRSEEQSKLNNVTSEWERLKRQRNIPTLDELREARDHRDKGWQYVFKAWKRNEAGDGFVTGTPLEEAYPQAVAAADGVADRLRTEADAVAQMEDKRTQREISEKALADIQHQREKLVEEKTATEAQWGKAWASCGMVPLSPREMTEWRENWVEFRRLWEEWSAGTERIVVEQRSVAGAVAMLQSALGVTDDHLESLLSSARTRIASHHKAAGAEATLRRQIEEKENALQEIREQLPQRKRDMDTAQSAWNACLSEFALPATLSPAQCIHLLRSRKELFAGYDQWRALCQECEALNFQIVRYEKDVAELITRFNLESVETESDEATLWKRLQSAKDTQNLLDALKGGILRKETELETVRQQAKQTHHAFDALLALTPAKSGEMLDGFLQQLEEKTKIRTRLKDLRHSLAGLSRNEAVELFIARVVTVEDSDSEGTMNLIDEKVSGLDAEIEALRNGLQELSNRRQAMESASDESAKQAQLAEFAVGRMQQDAERFARLQLAICLLKNRIDRFREQNQGPFMEKASHWFGEITGGAFAGITTQYDAGDRPVIAGHRAGMPANPQVAVEGMSEGTRDQLFLALRLAGLELHLEDHEPMPLILDDLLVNFDDARCLRALKALRSFGERSQVLLFTHHEHLVSLCRETLGDKQFHLHRLTGGGTAAPTQEGKNTA